MTNNKQPLIRFDNFATALEHHGIHVGEAKDAYREISSEEVTLREIREGSMEFEDNGIFVKMPDGSKQQVFLYKRSYDIAAYGKPRYHICKCQTIESFMNSRGEIPEYRKSNTMPVMVIDRSDGNKDKEVNGLPLCGYCARLLGNIGRGMTSDAFVEIMRKAHPQEKEPPRDLKVDMFGYTEDWHTISQAYREKHHFTCENCGVQVDPLESEYMHVHHISGDKTDNSEDNLQCLCIKCHSEVNATHVHNFARRSQQLLIAEFERKYGKQRKENLAPLPF